MEVYVQIIEAREAIDKVNQSGERSSYFKIKKTADLKHFRTADLDILIIHTQFSIVALYRDFALICNS